MSRQLGRALAFPMRNQPHGGVNVAAAERRWWASGVDSGESDDPAEDSDVSCGQWFDSDGDLVGWRAVVDWGCLAGWGGGADLVIEVGRDLV